MSFGRTAYKIASRYITNVPYDWSVRFLCQHIQCLDRKDKLIGFPKIAVNSTSLQSLSNLFPKLATGRLTPIFGACGDISPSKSNVCSIFHRQMTTFRRLPAHLQVRQAREYPQALDWFRSFFSQEISFGRLTPKERSTPRKLDRSW
jgi:hypothetical protein